MCPRLDTCLYPDGHWTEAEPHLNTSIIKVHPPLVVSLTIGSHKNLSQTYSEKFVKEWNKTESNK